MNMDQIPQLFLPNKSPTSAWPAIKHMLKTGQPYTATIAKRAGHGHAIRALKKIVDQSKRQGGLSWPAEGTRALIVKKVKNVGGKSAMNVFTLNPVWIDRLRALTGV